MRLSIAFAVVVVMGLLPAASSAQMSDMNTLAAQIREQEKTVETESGKSDGEAWLKLAIFRQDAAQYRDSERAYRTAIALLKSGDGASAILADALDHMGTMYAECGQFSKAESLERKALKIREDRKDVTGIGVSHMHLAVLQLGKRQIASAEAEAEMAVSLLVPEREHPAVQRAATPEEKMTALVDLSLARCARKNCAAAIPDLRRGLGIAHANYAENSIPVGFLDFLLGYALWKSGDNESAEGWMRKGTQELETQLGWGHPTYVQVLRQYSMFLNRTGHTADALDIATRIAKLERSPGFTQVASNQFSLGLDQLP
jgi:tetratricopeptide (TPR) repeat protein